VTLPSDLSGEHTIVLVGTDALGSPYVLSETVTVTATGTTDDPTATEPPDSGGDSGGGLAQTGAQTTILALAGVAAVLLGLMFFGLAPAPIGRHSARYIGRHRHL
jgi:hypothetical protein